MIATSAWRAALRREFRIASAGMRNVSRLRPAVPAASPSHAASMKSGPFLNGATRSPFRRKAAESPSDTRLLPASPASPAINTLGKTAFVIVAAYTMSM